MKRNPIFGSHWQRVGLLRLVLPAIGMYLVIPVYLFLHLICIKLLYNLMVCPLLGVERINLRNYIIIDRHLIPGISMTARFHCVYCGYANGLCVAMGVLLTHVSTEARISTTGFSRGLVMGLYLFTSFLSALCQSIVIFMYNITISPPLGLHRVSMKEAYDKMSETGFGDEFTVFGKVGSTFLRYEHSCALLLANALEQVESQWCPIKHLDKRPEVVYPEHHEFFVERCELCELKKILCTEGSVSPRKPRF
ncbi:hypothetical protein MMIC_P1392 [Mariprofundus micogutta]|uniref:Uncharacterized protein n=1 Tax=Mariprofundus micogutta TaxID=1921010 RepID=A0A1L8CNE8_9PROT|nr:hypothetical protein [Mariprofundus micogutta]GAV20427.1 hypothetical protein MMIC_P1392 [Mariprofundus micogutta]